MKQSIGGTYLIYFISIFILIVFAFLCGIINYMKAFKVNSTIANALENYEGYNSLSRTEIDNKLTTLGYRKGSSVDSTLCDNYSHGGTLETTLNVNHEVCISNLGYSSSDSNYFKYGITTFIYIDLPLIDEVKFSIYSETEKIYDFEK